MQYRQLRLIALLVLVFHSILTLVYGQETLAGQKHTPRYKLLDLGTFGGRASYVNPASELGGPNQMNRYGATVGSAATAILPAEGCVFCGGLDGQVPSVFHAFTWSDGITKDLRALPGDRTNSVAISNEGSAVGHSENGLVDPITGVHEIRAVLWKDGRVISLGTFGGAFSFAAMINNRGQAIGSTLNTIPDPFSFIGLFLGSSNSTQTRAFLWENGHKRDLGTLGGWDSFAGQINDRGEVTGISAIDSIPNDTTGVPTYHPFLWRNGNMIDLGSFGGTMAGVVGINIHGQVAGVANLPGDQSFDPFFWENGKLIDLYTDSVGGNPQTANALSANGEIIGAGIFPDHPHDAYVWKKGVATDLGTLDGDCSSEAFVIGPKGLIAGQSYSCSDASSARPFLWRDGQMFDLNQLIQHSEFTFTQAFVINSRGEIAGIGIGPGCDFDEDCGHALVLVPCSREDHGHDCDEIDLGATPPTSVDSRERFLNKGATLSGTELAARLHPQFSRKHIVPLPRVK